MSSWKILVVLASLTEIFFTSYLEGKSKDVCDRNQPERVMLGIIAATFTNKKHRLHLQPGMLL